MLIVLARKVMKSVVSVREIKSTKTTLGAWIGVFRRNAVQPSAHSFIPGLNLPFPQILPTVAFVFFLRIHRFPGLFTDTSEHSRFLLCTFFCFPLSSYNFVLYRIVVRLATAASRVDRYQRVSWETECLPGEPGVSQHRGIVHLS